MLNSNHDSERRVFVTGGNGFVAGHTIAQLLRQGYQVTTSMRDSSRQQLLQDQLAKADIPSAALTVVQADLLEDAHWHDAMAGCDYVLHLASPLLMHDPKDENDVIQPAVQGTLRILSTAQEVGVKRVVMTSNFGAVGYSHTDRHSIITEESWTNPQQKGLSVYNKSKVLAERAAWDYIASHGHGLELAVINPMAIFGPMLSNKMSAGHQLLQKLINGGMARIPDIQLGIVDVRDVADLHIRAMLSDRAAGQRFLALAGGNMTLLQIAQLVRRERPALSQRTSLTALPTWQLKLAALFSAQAKALLPMAGVYRHASNDKARNLLGWQPRNNEQAVLAAVQSLADYHLLD